MGTKLLSAIEKRCILEICTQSFVEEAWIVGGALLREDSKDIDIILLCKDPCEYDQANAFGTDSYKLIARHDQYDTEDGGKDLIVKLGRRDESDITRPIDLLCTSKEIFHGSIKNYMDYYFPMSIQRIALNINTGELTDNSDKDSSIVLVKPNIKDDAEYIQKYIRYYPDKTFYKEILKVEQSNEIPF